MNMEEQLKGCALSKQAAGASGRPAVGVPQLAAVSRACSGVQRGTRTGTFYQGGLAVAALSGLWRHSKSKDD